MPADAVAARLLADAWAALGGAPGDVAALELERHGPVLAAPLAVEELLVAAVGTTLLAAAELAEVRTGRRPAVALDVDAIAVAAASERHLRLDGERVGQLFDPVSAFWPARDGWVRLHGNYPWHRRAVLAALGVDTPDAIRSAVAARTAGEVEDAVVAAGGCAAAVRTPEAWATHPAGVAARDHGLVARDPGPATPVRPRSRAADARLPAAGLRVLDLTRVIAGPVGTRMLAALGADVTRVGDPARPELDLLALEGGLGKRWLELELRTAAGAARLEDELVLADVVVAGHRPGALDRFGLSAAALAERHPQLVVISLSAWGTAGPWGGRRGFDSLVQAASGIAAAVADGPPERTRPPGALPVQALDHATGYLVAAAALRALTDRGRTGRAGRASLALAATAHTLLNAGWRPAAEAREPDPAPHLVELAHPRGRLRVVRPPGSLDGRRLAWPS